MGPMGLLRGRQTATGYLPSLAHRLLRPAVSGNSINGLGEAAPRRPTPVYWHAPGRIPHGRLQRLFTLRAYTHPLAFLRNAFENERRQRRRPRAIAAERRQATPEEWSASLKEFALAHEADLVGIVPLDPTWVFAGYQASSPWVVMLGVAMNHAEVQRAPAIESANEVLAQYNRGLRAAQAVADWIRGQGYAATGHSGPQAGPINMIPAAIAAGFGELGKHGSIINRRLGSSFRLACVLTELPLVADAPDVFGAADFCARCNLCVKACPPRAIEHEQRVVRGERKWYVDFDKCLPYFNDTFGCAICLGACPWSLPGVAERLVTKHAQRRA